jgi:negative regulator of flagellin synthesis FlgM
MEINGKNPLAGMAATIHRLDAHEPQGQRPQKTGMEGAKPGSDRIELSIRSREIQQLDPLIQATPDIRTAKVEQIRSAVESGTYNVRAEMIADKIIGGNVIDEIF